MCTSGSDEEENGGTGSTAGAGGTSTATAVDDYPDDATPGDATASCSPVKAIAGSFANTAVQCGDRTYLDARGVNISEGSDISFSVYRGRDQFSLDSPTDVMFRQATHTEWFPHRPLGDRPGDVYFFDVYGDGETGQSSNFFQFVIRPNYGPNEQGWRCASGIYGWDAKFDIWFTADKVYLKLKIKLVQWYGSDPEHPGSRAGPVSDANKAFLKNDIEPRLSNKMFFNRQSCHFGNLCSCLVPVVVQVEFVESGEQHVVNYYQGEFRADSAHWPRLRYWDPMWAHEVGHLLGWYDEYTGGANGTPPRWQIDEPTHIMGTGDGLPPEYGWDFRDWLAGETGEPWRIST